MVSDGLSEGRIKLSVVQKDVGVIEPSIEMPLHRLDRLYYSLQLHIPCQDHKDCVRPPAISLRFETARHKDFIVFLADFSVPSKVSHQSESSSRNDCLRVIVAHLIEGGAPAGIITPPGEDGCRTTRTNMRMITRIGNNSNTANGTDTFEFPFNRIRLLKKSNLGNIRSFRLPRSSSAGACDEGICFASF